MMSRIVLVALACALAAPAITFAKDKAEEQAEVRKAAQSAERLSAAAPR
jgi:type II secretory pathway pseudopilin PulG